MVVTEGAGAAKVGCIRAHDPTRKAKRKILDIMLLLALSLDEKEDVLVVVTVVVVVVVVMMQQLFSCRQTLKVKAGTSKRKIVVSGS